MSMDKKKEILKAGGGIAGMVAIMAIVIAVNVIIGNFRMRADLTEEKLYTLSDGTRNLLVSLEQPVTLNLYLSSSSPDMPAQMKAYAKQVEDLLWEYRDRSKGNVALIKHDPKPDSDAEEWARRYGLAAQTANIFGSPIYFGLVAESGGVEAVLPGFDPAQQQKLEYNITRLIYRVTHPEKPKVGVISSLPVMGRQMPQFGMPPGQRPQNQPPWVAIQSISQDYDVSEITTPVEEIASDIDTLVVLHPKGLSDQTQYAIDQFVLRGGHLLMCVDPFSVADPGNPQAAQFGGRQMQQRSSDAPALLRAWGVGYRADQIVADLSAATMLGTPNGGAEQNMTVLSLRGTNGVNQANILTTQLNSMMLPYVGSFTDNTSEDLTFEPLFKSSDNSGLVSAMMAQFGPQAVKSEFKDGDVRFNLAVSLTGEFRTAFPDGQPSDSADSEEGEEDTPEEAPAEGLKSGTSVVILVGDVDLVFDPVCVEEVQMFGFRQQRARNDNLNFFANAIEMLSGSEDLVSVRSRGRFNRPFEKVMELQAKAAKEGRDREAELERKLRETEEELRQMQANDKGGIDQRFILTAEQKQRIEKFRAEEQNFRRQLKELRKSLRKDIESLGVKVKLFNIALMPLLVSFAGIFYGVYRRNK
ncbi:MAG: Gldg family protein [Kiritimatiellia bacterium]|nr:Gldg family protein [Kiritimatiellia bacterium]MDP6848098.1 Gldg family protein [Kiritimatiellia bacterium]